MEGRAKQAPALQMPEFDAALAKGMSIFTWDTTPTERDGGLVEYGLSALFSAP
jgi:hypothetical protein